MNSIKLQRDILEIIRSHQGIYPITAKEIQKRMEISVQKVHDILQILREKRRIKSRSFKWMKGKKLFHTLYEDEWPEFLFFTCGECHNKSTIKTCIFHCELYNLDNNCDLSRVGVKIGSESPGCPWFITRAEPQSRMDFQEFLEKTNEAKCDELQFNTQSDDQ